jgi:hypothetical protein
MWTCKKCNEEIEDVFDACWKCSTDEVISAKKTNWSVNKKRYRNTVLYTSVSFSLILIYLKFISKNYFYLDMLILTFSYPISIFLIFLNENKSKELKFEVGKAITVTLIITFIVSLFA